MDIDKFTDEELAVIEDGDLPSFNEEQATEVAMLDEVSLSPPAGHQPDIVDKIGEEPATEMLDMQLLATQLSSQQLFAISPLATKLAEKPYLYEVFLRTRGGTKDAPTIAELCALGSDDRHLQVQEWYLRQLSRLVLDVFDFLWISGSTIGELDDVIDGWDNRLFVELTGIDKKHFAELCADGFVVAERFREIGQQLMLWSNNNRQPEDYIYCQLDAVV